MLNTQHCMVIRASVLVHMLLQQNYFSRGKIIHCSST